MKLVKLKLSEINPDPNNTRVHDSHNIGVIKKSLDKFGQYRPFVVQKKGMMIRVGNGMYVAMKELGWPDAFCNVVDLTDDEAQALSILDNKSSDLSVFDDEKLGKIMSSLSKDSIDLTGFVSVELDSLMKNFGKVIEPEVMDPEKKKGKKDKKDIPEITPIRQYQIIFENDQQFKKWIEFVAKLREKYNETIPQCLVNYIEANQPEAKHE